MDKAIAKYSDCPNCGAKIGRQVWWLRSWIDSKPEWATATFVGWLQGNLHRYEVGGDASPLIVFGCSIWRPSKVEAVKLSIRMQLCSLLVARPMSAWKDADLSIDILDRIVADTNEIMRNVASMVKILRELETADDDPGNATE